MKLSTRVLSSTLAIAVLFTILILLVLFQYSESVTVTTEYAEETEPTREAIEHLLTTIYTDFLLVEEYLLITDYNTLLNYDVQLSHSEEQCEIITDEVDEMITLEAITDEGVIESYKTAVLVYSSWQRSRDELLSLHKQSIVTRAIPNREIRAEKERFITLMRDSSNHFAESLQRLNAQNVEFQKELAIQTKRVKTLIFVLLGAFLVTTILSSYFLIQRLTKPLDQMRKASIDFIKGNYKTRVPVSSSVLEISSLQEQLNRVYTLIDKTFKTKEQKTKASQQLLPPQYKDILDHIQSSGMQGRALTMKDIKKHFSLTHPTVVSRLRYLEQNGYIVIKKQGRNKCIFEA